MIRDFIFAVRDATRSMLCITLDDPTQTHRGPCRRCGEPLHWVTFHETGD